MRASTRPSEVVVASRAVVQWRRHAVVLQATASKFAESRATFASERASERRTREARAGALGSLDLPPLCATEYTALLFSPFEGESYIRRKDKQGMATPQLPPIGFRDSKSYTRLSSVEFPSSASSRAGSPAPLPPSDQFAYSTSLRRHEEHHGLLDFAHGAAGGHAAGAAAGGRDDGGGRFTAYDLPLGSVGTSNSVHYSHNGPGANGYAHHPLAHTTQPLTPSSHYASQSIPQTLSTLSTSATSGLPSEKVHAIREMSGPNEFEVAAKDPLWKRFADQFKEPLIMLLLGSAVVSVFVGNYDDAASIVVAVMIVVTG